eukprot:3673763-Prymnesium_polylepis.2
MQSVRHVSPTAHATNPGSVYGLCESSPCDAASAAVANVHWAHILSRRAFHSSGSSAMPHMNE